MPELPEVETTRRGLEPLLVGRKVKVLLSDIEGQNVVDVQTMLSEKGLKVLASPGEIVPADDPRVMDVYDAKPLGNLMSGSTIEIFYYVADTSGETPSPTPSQ